MSSDDDDLMRVTLFALENSEFRQMWDAAVREAADRATAMITGARMAGATGGSVAVAWDGLEFPVLDDLGHERSQAAFARAIMAEVGRRINAMSSPGSFG